MALPNFLIIGAQKAGTTWLADKLRQHPDIFIPRRELHFFNLKKNFEKGIEWYEHQFKGAKSGQKIGEKAPNYLWITSEAENQQARRQQHRADIHRSIHQYLPKAKLIVVVRDPVRRATSAINHYRRQGEMSPLWAIDEILFGQHKSIAERYGVFDMGRYYHQLQAYYQCFDSSQIMVVVFEENIARNPKRCLQEVCRFIEIDDTFKFSRVQSKVNAFVDRRVGTALLTHLPPTRPFFTWATRKRPGIIDRLDRTPLMGNRMTKQVPSDAVISQLYRFYTKDNQKLFDLLGHRITEWIPS